MEQNGMDTPEIPSLTLSPGLPELELETAPPQAEITQAQPTNLTPEEQKMVSDFAQKINITDSTQVLQYGSGAQKKISDFSQNALSKVRGTDLDEVGKMITGLVTELKGFSTEGEQKGFLGLFKKAGNQMGQMKAKYDSVEKNVDKICDVLDGHKITLLKDVAMLDKMYDMNLAYYKELTMYTLAGRQKLSEVIEQELPALQGKARQSGKPEDAQAANDLAEMCNRFDKKLHDLELTRTISMQMGPQIRLVQGNNSIMVEKIQSSLVNTIPLWKNQMVLALGLAHTQNAIQAQRQVTDITNELLRKNADTLKVSTIEAARESERSIVDIETLRHTNEQLISTLDEVIQIQRDGTAKRRDAEAELQRIEGELKNKLLEIRDSSKTVQ